MSNDNLFDPYEIAEDEREPAGPVSLFDVLEGENTRWDEDAGEGISFTPTSDAEQEYLSDAPEGDYLRRVDEIRQARTRERYGIRDREAFARSFWKFDTVAEKIAHHNGRAKDRGNAGSLTEKQWSQLRRAFGGSCCAYCGCGCAVVLEHVRPVALGGETTVANILPSCFDCNRRKGLLSLVEWQTDPSWWREFRRRITMARKIMPSIPDHGRSPGSP